MCVKYTNILHLINGEKEIIFSLLDLYEILFLTRLKFAFFWSWVFFSLLKSEFTEIKPVCNLVVFNTASRPWLEGSSCYTSPFWWCLPPVKTLKSTCDTSLIQFSSLYIYSNVIEGVCLTTHESSGVCGCAFAWVSDGEGVS